MYGSSTITMLAVALSDNHSRDPAKALAPNRAVAERPFGSFAASHDEPPAAGSDVGALPKQQLSAVTTEMLARIGL